MKTSESISEIIKALVAAQAEITNPAKDSDNPYYKSKYASLPDCIDATKPILTKHGLVIVQSVEGNEVVEVVTRLCHVTGQWMEGTVSMTPTKNDPQGAASASTYGRRYGLMAMLGIAGADMDDDGAVASGTVVKRPPVNSPTVEKTSEQIPPVEKSSGVTKEDVEEIFGRGDVKTGVTQPPVSAEPGPSGEMVLVTVVKGVTWRPSGKSGKFFTVTTEDGRRAGTFSETLAQQAKALKLEGARVVLVTAPSKDGNYLDLVDICKTAEK